MTTNNIPKLAPVKSLLDSLRKADYVRRDLTISALYHAMINNNVAFLDNAEQHDLALLDGTVKKFFPVNMIKNDKKEFLGFKYSKDLNVKFKTELNIPDDKDNKIEWEEFYLIMLSYWEKNHVKAKKNQLTAEQLFEKRQENLENLLKLFLTNGGNKNMVLDMLLKLEKSMPNLVTEEENKEVIPEVPETTEEVVEVE